MAYFPDIRENRSPTYEERTSRFSPTDADIDGQLSTRSFSSSYDDGFDDLDTYEDDNASDVEYDENGYPIQSLTPEERAELRKSNSRVFSGVASFIAVIIGVVLILVLVSLLISLFNFLSSDISQTFTLFRNII